MPHAAEDEGVIAAEETGAGIFDPNHFARPQGRDQPESPQRRS
jgi:hypothetical protein